MDRSLLVPDPFIPDDDREALSRAAWDLLCDRMSTDPGVFINTLIRTDRLLRQLEGTQQSADFWPNHHALSQDVHALLSAAWNDPGR